MIAGFQRACDIPWGGRDPPAGRRQQEAQHSRRRRQPGRTSIQVSSIPWALNRASSGIHCADVIDCYRVITRPQTALVWETKRFFSSKFWPLGLRRNISSEY